MVSDRLDLTFESLELTFDILNLLAHVVNLLLLRVASITHALNNCLLHVVEISVHLAASRSCCLSDTGGTVALSVCLCLNLFFAMNRQEELVSLMKWVECLAANVWKICLVLSSWKLWKGLTPLLPLKVMRSLQGAAVAVRTKGGQAVTQISLIERF